jgi:hypothetical protein
MGSVYSIERILKGITFFLGLLALVYGALFLDYPDWDIGISLIMAFATLATAQWSVSVLWELRLFWVPLAAFYTWLCVDGVYWAYWSLVRPEVMIREGQWLASLCLYLLCGVIWYRLVPIAALWVQPHGHNVLHKGSRPQ